MSNSIYDTQNVIEQLNQVINDSEKMSQEVMKHLEVVLEKLDTLIESKDIQSEVDGIKNNIFNTMASMQSQDFHVQRIQRVVNNIDPNCADGSCAKHIAGDDTEDLLNQDDLEALIAQMGNN